MKKEIILGIDVKEIDFLHYLPGFEQVWKYYPEESADSREFGRIKTQGAIFKLYAFSLQPDRLNPEDHIADARKVICDSQSRANINEGAEGNPKRFPRQ